MQKFQVAPRTLPDHLAWFKWEAYTTWLSGFGLMLVLYYLDARATMIDPSVADLEPWSAVTISLALLVAAWVAYDLLNRSLAERPLSSGPPLPLSSWSRRGARPSSSARGQRGFRSGR